MENNKNEIDYPWVKDDQRIYRESLSDEKDKMLDPVPKTAGTFKGNEDDSDYFDLMHYRERATHNLKPELWGDLNKKVFPKERWRINNILPKRGFSIVAGISGEGKTWVCLEMAKAISSGKDFLGYSGFNVLKGNVLYLDLEMSESELQRRGRQLGFEDTTNSLFILNYGDVNFSDEDRGDVAWLLNYIEKYEICTVFVDTFRAAAGGIKEEKAEEVRKFFNRFISLKNKDVCLVFTEHFRKPSNFEGKIPKKEHLFSSQDKVASVETLLMLQGQDGGETIHAYQRKNRIGREIQPFKIGMRDQIDPDNEDVKTVFTYEGEIDNTEKKQDQAKEFILEYLQNGGKTRKEILEAAYQATKIGERNVSAALRELGRCGLVDVQKEGRNNFYTIITEEKNNGEIINQKDDW